MKREKDVSSKGIVTSKDVAELAKVSQATVSRVFSRNGYVKGATAQRVMEAAKQLGYSPNAIARSLNSKQTDLIAVVTVDFDNPFYQAITSRLSVMIEEMGKQMLLIQSGFETELDQILERVLQYRVDGVVVVSAAISSHMMTRITQINTPLVIFNKQFDSRFFFSVCSDNLDAGAMVADYFWERGYRSFGYISGNILRQTSGNRHKGYVDRLATYGVKECIVANGDYSYQSGCDALLKIAAQGQLPRAIFCANDLMAFGAMDTVRFDLGLRVPEDVAFVGFDDLQQSSWKNYQLTSVSQPLEEMVEYTRSYLARKLASPEATGGYLLLKCRIHERGSC